MLELLAFVLLAVAVIVHDATRRQQDRAAGRALLTAGLLHAVLPGRNLTLDPHAILTFVIPPLIYSAALRLVPDCDQEEPADGDQPVPSCWPPG